MSEVIVSKDKATILIKMGICKPYDFIWSKEEFQQYLKNWED